MSSTIDAFIIANAGADLQICDDSTVALNGSVTGGGSTGHWSGGLGTFTPNRSALNATYHPHASEAGTTVTIYLVPEFGENVCAPDSDALDIIVDVCDCTNPVVVQAGPDIHTCVDGEVSLNGSITGAITTGHWTGGTGTFTPDRNDLNATYTPAPSEV